MCGLIGTIGFKDDTKLNVNILKHRGPDSEGKWNSLDNEFPAVLGHTRLAILDLTDACAVPVVAFNTGGLPDIVKHNETGYLAKAFDTEDFAKGIISILSQRSQSLLGNNARERAIAQLSENKITTSYLKIYEKILDMS